MYSEEKTWGLGEWLTFIEKRNTQEIQLGLTRIQAVAHRMNLLNPNCTVITVTGTNGKGSTIAALEMVYHTAGYKVGAYTSPHLIRFNERIRLNSKPMSDEAICHAFSAIEAVRDDVVLTYFEMATLAALWLFKQQHLDIMLLEVGIGGRLDATHIIDPDLSIITTVDFDHQDYLGTTLEAIGFEKAGILRQGKPFIYADSNPPLSVIKAAKDLSTPSYYYGRDYFFDDQGAQWVLDALDTTQYLSRPRIGLKSAAAALVACALLQRELPVSGDVIDAAMKAIVIEGRLQLIKTEGVFILYDVSHNPQSVALLAHTIKQRLGEQGFCAGKIHAVFSALKDKDILGLILPLKDCVNRWYPAQLQTPRAASSEFLLSVFGGAEINVEICYNSPLAAFDAAFSQANAGDLIVVYGSFYTVGHVMLAQQNLLEEKEI